MSSSSSGGDDAKATTGTSISRTTKTSKSTPVTKVTSLAATSGLDDDVDLLRHDVNDLFGRNFSTTIRVIRQAELNYTTTGCLRNGALPVALSSDITCLTGFFCPNSTTDTPPQYCPPIDACQLARSEGRTCSAQGAFEPVICAAGSYCSPGGKTQVVCPSGSYCPYGTTQPIRCLVGSYCPVGSAKQTPILPVGMVLLTDALILAITFVFLLLLRRHRAKQRRNALTAHYSTPFGFGDFMTHDAVWHSKPPQAAWWPRKMSSREDDRSLFDSRITPKPTRTLNSASRKASAASHYHRSSSRRHWGSLSSSRYSRATSFRSTFFSDPEKSHRNYKRRYPSSRRRPSSPSVVLPSRFSPTSSAGTEHSGYACEDIEAGSTTLKGFAYDDILSADTHQRQDDLQTYFDGLVRAANTQETGLSFQLRHASCSEKGVSHTLDNISVSIPNGSMFAVMGGAGAGKRTFSQLLTGKLKTTLGSIMTCGFDLDLRKCRKVIGHVPKQDSLFAELTVRENILHSARCRLPKIWKEDYIQTFIDALISCLGLNHIRHCRVGIPDRSEISTGQRKLISIGIELAAAPMAIVLEEPMLDLDSSSAATVMRVLQMISGLGVTTITTMQRTSHELFVAFDSVLLLAQGRQIFEGPTIYCEDYFANQGFRFPDRANPADVVMDIITGEGSRYSTKSAFEVSTTFLRTYWSDRGRLFRWPPSPPRKETLEQRKLRKAAPSTSVQTLTQHFATLTYTIKSRGASWPAQLLYVMLRAFRQQYRLRLALLIEVGIMSLAGLAAGLCFFSHSSELFRGVYHAPFTILSPAVNYSTVPLFALFASLAIGVAAAGPAARVFGHEKRAHTRELGRGHSRSAYFVAKQLLSDLRIALMALHFTTLQVALAAPRMTFVEAMAVNTAYMYAIYGLGMAVSAVCDEKSAPVVATVVAVSATLFSGAAPALSTVRGWHIDWAWRLAPSFWVSECYFDRIAGPTNDVYDLQLAEQTTAFTLGRFWAGVAVIFTLGFAYRVLAFLLMIAVDRVRRRR